MQYVKTNGTTAFTLFFAVLLGAGVALAMQTESRSVPSGNHFSVTAELTAGESGALVYGVRTGDPETGDNEVDFSIGFGTNGTIVVNGVQGPEYEEDGVYIVVVDATSQNGQWTADISIHEDVSGATVYQQSGYVMNGKPEYVVAEAQSIARLIVLP